MNKPSQGFPPTSNAAPRKGTAQPRVNCHQCRHFYVTWEKATPYGCKGHEFKSAALPSLVVMRSSGTQCLLYSPKQPR